MIDFNERSGFEQLWLQGGGHFKYFIFSEEQEKYIPTGVRDNLSNQDLLCASITLNTAYIFYIGGLKRLKAQAVPDTHILVPRVPTEKFKADLKQYLDELWWGDYGCDWDGFVSVSGIDPLKIYALAIEASESGANP